MRNRWPLFCLPFLLSVQACGTDPDRLLEEAEAAREMGLHDAALKRYTDLKESYPEKFPQLDEKIGDVYASQGLPQKALASWEKALQKNPQSAKLWSKKGSFLVHAGKREAGKDALLRAVSLDAENHTAHLNLGVANLQDRQLPEALTHLAKAAELAPKDPTVLKTLGIALLTAGKRQEGAIVLYKAWVEDASVMKPAKLFALLFSAQLWPEAVEVGEKAVQEDSSPQTLVNYADSLIRSGDGEKGGRIYMALDKMQDLPPALKKRVTRVLEHSRRLAAEMVENANTSNPVAPSPKTTSP